MTQTQVFRPVVRNVQNNDLYFYEGGLKFTNIRTGKSGDIETEVAEKVLKINVGATEILNEYPEVVNMIKQLNLKCDGISGL